jgi:hypothetical protein
MYLPWLKSIKYVPHKTRNKKKKEVPGKEKEVKRTHDKIKRN